MAHKYRAVRTEVDGIAFHSKMEAAYYCLLKLMLRAGEIKGFRSQVTYKLQGGIKYIVDFVVERLDGAIEPIEIKGVMTQAGRIKIKLFQELYGLPVRVLTLKKGKWEERRVR